MIMIMIMMLIMIIIIITHTLRSQRFWSFAVTLNIFTNFG